MTDHALTSLEPAALSVTEPPATGAASFEDIVAEHLRALESIAVTDKHGDYASYLFPDGASEYAAVKQQWDDEIEAIRNSRFPLFRQARIRDKKRYEHWRLSDAKRDLSRRITRQALAALEMIQKAAPVLTEAGARPEVLDRAEAAVDYAVHLAHTCSTPRYGAGDTPSSMQANPAHRALLVLAAEVQALVSLEMQREALVRALDSRTLSSLAAKTVEDINDARAALSASAAQTALAPILTA